MVTIIILILLIRFIIFPLFMFLYIHKNLEDSIPLFIVSVIPILGELTLYHYLKTIYYERRNKRNKLS